MQNKTLVSFGDSWPQGSELRHGEKPFGKLLSEKLGCKDFNNYSMPASSINHLSVQLNSHIKSWNDRIQDLSDSIAVFFLTGQERFMVYDDFISERPIPARREPYVEAFWKWWTSSPTSTPHNNPTQKGLWFFQNPAGGFSSPSQDKKLCNLIDQAYWKYIYSPELSDVTTNNTIIALQTMCRHYRIKDYYVAGWQLVNFWPTVDTTKIYKNGIVNCMDLIKGHKAEGGHPNQQGHQLIADALYEWIKTDAR